jgi:hypothetical protein
VSFQKTSILSQRTWTSTPWPIWAHSQDLAGIWEGVRGLDVNPKAEGPRKQAYLEHIELQPIDPQANGPQHIAAYN